MQTDDETNIMRVQSEMNPLETLQYEEELRTTKNNEIYMTTLIIGLLVVVTSFLCIIFDVFGIKNRIKEKYKNQNINVLIDTLLPSIVVLLSLYPAYVLLHPAITRTIDDEKTTNLRFGSNILMLIVVILLILIGLILPLILMGMNNTAEDEFRRLNIFDSQRYEDLTWCILCIIIGSCLLILANLYALRHVVFDGAIIASSMGYKTILLFILGLLVSTGASTSLQLFISRRSRQSLTDRVNRLTDEELSDLNAALDRNFPKSST